jgi:steroid 5-alpha reductase family enzyme
MNLVLSIAALAAFLSAAMAFAWRVTESGGRSGWIDAIWTFATGLASVAAALWGAAPGALRPALVAVLAAVWSLRLGLHIVARTTRGGDDPRYRQLRAEWGDRASGRLFLFLQAQAAAGLMLAFSVAIAAHRPGAGPDLRDMIGIALFVAALAGEAASDQQLAQFAADVRNRGKICDVGLWSVSRHPNYFFEWLVWVAFAAVAFDPAVYPSGWLALAAPALMYALLVHVSGIPPLEAHMLRSRGDAFRAYQARVNAFWPGPPRMTATPATGAAS